MTVIPALTVIHDDTLRNECTSLLATAGFSVTALPADGRLALEAVRLQRPQVVVLEAGTADGVGGHFVRALRRFSDAYLVVLDADGNRPRDRTRLLEAGADDVVTGPLDGHLLRDRVAILRRRPGMASPLAVELREHEGLVVDVAAREVLLQGVPVDLTRTEFDLLCRLTENPRRVLTREALISDIWGLDWYNDGHALDVHIANLRGKLGESGRQQRYIETVRGVGFRFNPAPDSVAT